jgi:tRNA dimethylallyltransferase
MSREHHTAQWLALAGPTASGKTAMAMAIARRWPVEIVSVDSALVYRGMDIGTAKPTPEEQAETVHHLIDIRDPWQAYSAAEFVHDAQARVREIWARGRIPLLVGGTMLYFKALFDGLDALPPAQPAIRARLESEAAQLGWPALHARLALCDPITAARLSPQDAQRIGRALEVYEATGQPLSSLHTRSTPDPDRPSALSLLGSPGKLWSLEPQQRAWLHERIGQRFDAMLAQGLIEEVRRLRAHPGLHPDLPAMRCVGYRQVWQWLDAVGPSLEVAGPNPRAWAMLRDTGIAATRQLAKRQLTWLRSMPQREVLACDHPHALAHGLQAVEQALGHGA